MRHHVLWLALAVTMAMFLPARAASADCDGTTLQSGARTIAVGTAMRTFIVRVPPGHSGRLPAPVVVAFHPFGTSAPYMLARAGISEAWPDAMVVYPNGMARDATNPGLGWQGRPGELDDRDLRFFDAMVAWLVARVCVDEKRLFVLGYSNGAGLAYLLACERRARVAGVAVAAGRLGCAPVNATPVVISHGIADTTVGYGQAVEAAQIWAVKNVCKAPPKNTGSAGCAAADGCAASALMLCTHAGGHEYERAFTRTAVEFFKAIR
jgi:polyhydroxybutyrate depolymerase